jgi:hypothetical protein
MKTLTRLLLTLGVFWALLGASGKPSQRSGSQLCREVQLELKEQLDEGMITEGEAAWIAIRCYDLFSDD